MLGRISEQKQLPDNLSESKKIVPKLDTISQCKIIQPKLGRISESYLDQKKTKNYGEIELTQVQGTHTPIVSVDEYERV